MVINQKRCWADVWRDSWSHTWQDSRSSSVSCQWHRQHSTDGRENVWCRKRTLQMNFVLTLIFVSSYAGVRCYNKQWVCSSQSIILILKTETNAAIYNCAALTCAFPSLIHVKKSDPSAQQPHVPTGRSACMWEVYTCFIELSDSPKKGVDFHSRNNTRPVNKFSTLTGCEFFSIMWQVEKLNSVA